MLVAVQVLKANQGTRFIQITSNDGWDMHQNIYSAGNLPAKGKLLDNAVSAMLGDLKSTACWISTLVVMVGEFGRTVGPLTAAAGRDHLAAAVRVLRRRRRQGRNDHRADQRLGRRHLDLRLVAESLRLSRGHRGHHLLGDGHRLDHGPPRRPAGPRIPIRPDDRPGAVFPGQRTLGELRRGLAKAIGAKPSSRQVENSTVSFRRSRAI